MTPISVVIIAKNEAESLAKSLPLLTQITDDIILIDNDSTDHTVKIARDNNCRVYQKNWDGYGANKNKGIKLARYNWILSIDADEIPDHTLLTAILTITPGNDKTVYDINYKAYYGDKLIRFGNWGRDHHVRLFNRLQVKWTESPVHETLILPKKVNIQKLEGYLHHYSVKNEAEHQQKTIHYAQLSALKYLKSGKKASWIKMYLAPTFHFVKIYLLLLGFLDGAEGFKIAKMAFKNTRLKYYYLSNASQAASQKLIFRHDLPAMGYRFNADARVE
jgi:glycosyltransferase involved in cell wall biosynthesis